MFLPVSPFKKGSIPAEAIMAAKEKKTTQAETKRKRDSGTMSVEADGEGMGRMQTAPPGGLFEVLARATMEDASVALVYPGGGSAEAAWTSEACSPHHLAVPHSNRSQLT